MTGVQTCALPIWLANAVTRFSQDVESYDRATKLEEIGYSVMTMSPALFRQMNRTELLAA